MAQLTFIPQNYIMGSGINGKSMFRKQVEILRKSVTVKVRYWVLFHRSCGLRQPENRLIYQAFKL